ncbi:MAG: alternate F1F0 ATPase, F1 subunit alpha [Parachlamydiales bacterium]|jgi:F-type H+-transporting ATPase subunit alpha
MDNKDLKKVFDNTLNALDQELKKEKILSAPQEVGIVKSVDKGIAKITGLDNVELSELVKFKNNKFGIVFNLEPDEIGIVLLDKTEEIQEGDEVLRTKRIMSCPVGETLLGRVVDPVGRALDEKGPLKTNLNWPIEREAPRIMDRSPVTVPLQTGVLVIDSLIPIGRGQRELIIGDRQTGKTTIALDTIINQKDQDVICIYCAIGQKSSSVKKVVLELQNHGMLNKCIIVVATGEDSPGLNYIAPYSATTMGEYFRDQGKDVLVVYDDLTRHAWSYREISLLLRRPPAREAYPGDIFYIHARLLERATHLKDKFKGGSLTALPIIETEAQNIAAYIPTNLISITDGQIYLSPSLFQEGQLPAIDVGKSVSRVGGKTQLLAYRSIVKDLRLTYSQFQELEIFSRFGTHLEEETQKILERGYRVREVLKQMEYHPKPVFGQIVILQALMHGLFDDIKLENISKVKEKIINHALKGIPEISDKVIKNNELSEEDLSNILSFVKEVLKEK